MASFKRRRNGGSALSNQQNQPLNRTEIINHAVYILEKLANERDEMTRAIALVQSNHGAGNAGNAGIVSTTTNNAAAATSNTAEGGGITNANTSNAQNKNGEPTPTPTETNGQIAANDDNNGQAAPTYATQHQHQQQQQQQQVCNETKLIDESFFHNVFFISL